MNGGLPRPGSHLNIEVFDPFASEVRLQRLTVARDSLFVVPDSAEFNTTLGRWRVGAAVVAGVALAVALVALAVRPAPPSRRARAS